MELLFALIIILLGLVFGKIIEKRHYASILEREEKYRDIIVLSDKDTRQMQNIFENNSLLITEGTVVSIDAFKKFMAGLVNIFGGRIKAYESLVDRARREAVLKVKETAYNNDYNAIVNLRIETSRISQNTKNQTGTIEAIAYASGVKII